jgi:predicted ribosomally synthesized peptide with nif11-like leader
MSVENVKLFYARLAVDDVFRTQVQAAKTPEEGYQLAQAKGFEFTSEEFEAYTSQILEGSADDVQPLEDKELAGVVGGMLRPYPNLPLIYGGPWPENDWWQN